MSRSYRRVDREIVEAVSNIIGLSSGAESCLRLAEKMRDPVFFESPGAWLVVERDELRKALDDSDTPPAP